MAEENHTGIEKLPGSGRTSARNEKAQSSPKRQRSPLNWDFESSFQLEQNVNHPGRVRASSWDDSDDNLPTTTGVPVSETCRIYTNDDRKPKTSVTAEISKLKKQFFTSRENDEEIEGNSWVETVNDDSEAKLNYDRRLSPARIRRRSRSSGSLSPVLEVENQVSPKQTNKSSDSDTEFQDISPKPFQYDPTFYLNHFFTELKSKSISLIDPISVIESIEKDIPKYDSDVYNELCALDGKDTNSYFCKRSTVLPQILEVEENRKCLHKHSEENLASSLLQKCFKSTEVSPLLGARSRRSDKSTEEGRKVQKDRCKSFSSEYLKPQKPQNEFQGSLSERSPRFFDGKLDHDFISLSAKTGKTQLASPKCLGDRGNITPVQVFCLNTSNGDDKSILDHLEDETSDNTRTSTERSEQSNRTGKLGSFKAESPKFMLNIGIDSARSLKVEDVDDTQRKECSFRNVISEDGSQPRTERIPPITVKSVESVISTRTSKREEWVTNRSKAEYSIQKSSRKSRPQTSNAENEERILPETKRHSAGESQKASPVGKPQKASRKSSAKSTNKESEQVTTTPNSNSSRISKSPRTKTPKTGSSTARNNNIPKLTLPIDIDERPEFQKASVRSSKTGDTIRKDSDRSGTKRRSYRPSDRSTNSKSKPASPRGLKMISRTNSASSRRSKDSLENRDEIESGRTHSWKESERFCDTVSNNSLISSANSWRETEIPSQQHSYRSDIRNPDNHEMENTSKQQLSRSRNSSRISVNSSNVTETDGKSPKQSYCTLTESPSEKSHRRYHPEDEEEEENLLESHTFTQRSKTGDESDRLSHKRLSVINEVSFEDLETSNASAETLGECRPCTRQDTNRTSPERTSMDESASVEFVKPEKEQWDKLINEFNKSPKSFVLNKFPGFPVEKDMAWNATECVQSKMDGCECEENSEENPFSRHKTQKCLLLEKPMPKNLNNLVYPTPLSEKPKEEEFVQAAQNIYYVNVRKGGPFLGIGGFGDVTCWNAGDFDTKDLEKPKDHGDGIPTRATELRLPEKEVKTQLAKDFRESTPILQDLADDEDFTHPCRLKASKSDNCINKKVSGGDECQTSTDIFINGSRYKATDEAFGESRNRKKQKFTSKSTVDKTSSSESLEDWENLEFAYERTPRLSRSLSNLNVGVRENIYEREPSEALSMSGNQLFKCDASKQQEEPICFNASPPGRTKEDKMAEKSSNWLKSKHPEAKHSAKRGKKDKTKFTKKSKEPFHNYLSSGKRTAVVPALKLRNPNCFQNFYKRFISVFCLTSSSSAATSK